MSLYLFFYLTLSCSDLLSRVALWGELSYVRLLLYACVCLCVGAIAIASVVLSVLLLLLLLPVIDSSATRCGLFISFFIAGAASSPPLSTIPPPPPH